ncbi:MAG: response regulator transcription factor [Anaerolineales bacterium]
MTRAMAARLLKSVASQSINTERGQEALTEREIDVLRLVAQGASNPQIAETLCISVNTVKTHLKNILAKLQLDNRTQAATYAVQSGLVSTLDSH